LLLTRTFSLTTTIQILDSLFEDILKLIPFLKETVLLLNNLNYFCIRSYREKMVANNTRSFVVNCVFIDWMPLLTPNLPNNGGIAMTFR